MYAVDVVALGTVLALCVTTGLPCGCEAAGTECAQEHAVSSSCNRQHGVQAHFSAWYMGVHGLLPFNVTIVFSLSTIFTLFSTPPKP